jgi:hypothetical protein
MDVLSSTVNVTTVKKTEVVPGDVTVVMKVLVVSCSAVASSANCALNAVPFPTSVLVMLLIEVVLDSLIVDVKEMASGNGVSEDIDVRSESELFSTKLA